MMRALMPLFALGSTAGPILQAQLSRRVDADFQCALMGLLSSFASIFGPLSISVIYFANHNSFAGLVWVRAAALYLVCFSFLIKAANPEQVVAAAWPRGVLGGQRVVSAR